MRKIIIGAITVATVGSVATIGNNIELKRENEKLASSVSKLTTSNERYCDEVEGLKIELADKDLSEEVLKATNTELQQEISNLEKKVSKLEKVYPTETSTELKPISRSVNNRDDMMEMTLTFYGDSAEENGGYAGIDAQGNKLVAGTVASNVYPFGTTFIINGQTFTVRDRGGSNFDSPNRLDVFVPRNAGESDLDYAKRISKYGKITVTTYRG